MITYQQEPFDDKFISEFRDLSIKHYEELCVTKHPDFPLDPDFDTYKNAQAGGRLLCMCCRKDGKLIGYIVFHLSDHLHYRGCRFASEDMYFIDRDERKGTVGVRLFTEAEKLLKEHGVDRVHISCKVHLDHTKLFERLGYNMIEKHFSKYL